MNSVSKWDSSGFLPCLSAWLSTSRLPSPRFLHVLELVGKVDNISAWCPGHPYKVSVSPRPWKSHLPEVGMTDLLSGVLGEWLYQSMRSHRKGVGKSAPSQTCRKKPCSVRPSARCRRGRETGASSVLFTNQEPWSDRRAVGVAGDQIHPGLFSCWCNTLFMLLLFSARLPTKPKLAY